MFQKNIFLNPFLKEYDVPYLYVRVETRISDRSGRRFFSRISHDCQVAKIKFTDASIAITERY
jgi:hypothetical protein